MVGLMATSKRVYTRGDLPSLLLPVSHPVLGPWPTHTSTGDPHTSRWFWFSLPWSCYSFPLGLGVCMVLLCPPRLESLFPPVLWKSCNQTSLAFKVRFPGDSQSEAGKTDVGFRTFTTVGELLWYYFSPVCGSPTHKEWDLILL